VLSNIERIIYTFCNKKFDIHHPNMKRPTKKISFNDSVTVHHISSRSEISLQEKIQAYYSKEDLRCFESETIAVRNRLIQQARSLFMSNPAASPAEHFSLLLESDASLRGFEVRFCINRIRNKIMVLKAVHEYQKKLRRLGSSFPPCQREKVLAEAYFELSRWSKVQALEIARADEVQAHWQDDDDDAPLLPVITVSRRTLAIVEPESKRQLESCPERCGRKRCKLV
jgi:hypothetical protein